jgi:Outer membrane protein beta-barrel domain
MKKTFLLILLTASMQSLFAQAVSFGIKAGLNESTATFTGTTSTFSDLSGFNAGVFADIKFNRLSVEPGIFYTTSGYNSKSIFTTDNPAPYSFIATGKVAYNYFQVPVNILYHIPAGPLKIFVGAGPYWGLALSGTRQGTSTSNGIITNSPSGNITFGSSAGDFSKTDLGVNTIAGITLKNGVLFSVNYGFGLTNISNSTNSKGENRVLSLSLGYEFL